MFTQNRGATACYRTLARGYGRSWAQTYKAAQQQRMSQVPPGSARKHVVHEAHDHRAIADGARHAV
jgi:hypothetical protein